MDVEMDVEVVNLLKYINMDLAPMTFIYICQVADWQENVDMRIGLLRYL